MAEVDVSKYDWYDVRKEPSMKIHGLYKPEKEGRFIRFREDVSQTVSRGVFNAGRQTAGGRIRFKTDSRTIAVKSESEIFVLGNRTPMSASCGYDVYAEDGFGKQTYSYTLCPMPTDDKNFSDCGIITGKKGMRTVTLNMPVNGTVTKLEIGLQKGSKLELPDDYAISKPVIYYGSSITHGSCASRPGNTYESIISRELDCDFINFGFGGLAKGEPNMAKFIATLDSTAVVIDYDHNSEGSEYLQSTHENFFKIIREAKPNLPIILVSKPDFHFAYHDEHLRRGVVMQTYINARRNGDKNVHFVDGAAIFRGYSILDCTLDDTHPNDLGFAMMAKMIGYTLREAIMCAN